MLVFPAKSENAHVTIETKTIPVPSDPALTVHTASVSEIFWKLLTIPPVTVNVEALIHVAASLKLHVIVYRVPAGLHIHTSFHVITTLGTTVSIENVHVAALPVCHHKSTGYTTNSYSPSDNDSVIHVPSTNHHVIKVSQLYISI